MRKIISIVVIILLTFLIFRVTGLAHHREDHNPPVPPRVCEDLPSQEHNPHCDNEPVEPEQPSEPVDETPTETEPEAPESVLTPETPVILTEQQNELPGAQNKLEEIHFGK